MRTEGTAKVREALRDYLKALKTGELNQRGRNVLTQWSLLTRLAIHWQVLGFVVVLFLIVTSWDEISQPYQSNSLSLSNVAAARSFRSGPGCLVLPQRPLKDLRADWLASHATQRNALPSACHFSAVLFGSSWETVHSLMGRCLLLTWGRVTLKSLCFQGKLLLGCVANKNVGVRWGNWIGVVRPNSVLPLSTVLAGNLHYTCKCQGGCTARFHSEISSTFLSYRVYLGNDSANKSYCRSGAGRWAKTKWECRASTSAPSVVWI